MKERALTFVATAIIVAAAAALPTVAQEVPSIAGEWTGSLDVGGTALPLIFHIQVTDEGLSATMDSPNQGAMAMPIDTVSFVDNHLTLLLTSIGGGFEGDLGEDGTISGEWKQSGNTLALDLGRVDTSEPDVEAEESPVDGHWRGVLHAGGMDLTVVIHLAMAGSTLRGTMDSPDQGALGIGISSVTFSDGHLSLQVAAIGGSYEADHTDEDRLEGTWSQGGNSFPLELDRIEESAAMPKRPQEPKEPFPYRVEDVVVQTPVATVRLAGTLTQPTEGERWPTAILISGSGPQNRDEELMGHKPFLVIADHLTRHGIAVLRLDDRGVGKSTGSFATATTEDFADDTLAAVEFLRKRDDVDEIGLIGHSEGGIVAPIVANRSEHVDFVVLLAGPGLTGEEILYLQSELIILANGGVQAAADKNRDQQESLFAILKEEPDDEAAERRLREVLSAAFEQASVNGAPADIEPQIKAQLGQLLSPWFRFFLTYDPAPELERLQIPVLAMNGEKDTQVPPKENLGAIRAALTVAGNDDFELVELEGLNHLFQTARSGAPTEYAKIEETISPIALETLSEWILERVE